MEVGVSKAVTHGGATYTIELSSPESFRMIFLCDKLLLLHGEFEAMVVDQTLLFAHQEGLIPVGPVTFSHEDLEFLSKPKLAEGERVIPFGSPAFSSSFSRVRVTAEVMVGASLGI